MSDHSISGITLGLFVLLILCIDCCLRHPFFSHEISYLCVLNVIFEKVLIETILDQDGLIFLQK